MDKEWLVWSIEHGAWWGPGSDGYVLERGEAGRYTFDEAKAICLNANKYQGDTPNETMVLEGAFVKEF